ncbi:MAG: 50S ribosomal protein L10 [Nanoarchaeota archaeon]|nr:50S ribosomal protein L10 [Nanoarchaeota archaeon]
MAKVAEHKKITVKEITTLIDKYPIIGIVNMKNLPAKQLQTMREQLRNTVIIRMTKKRLIKIAFEQSKKEDLTKLSEYLKGMPALIFTNDNPFKLFATLKKNKSTAPIKAGQVAPNNIIVKAGPTGFSPGPIISELAAFRIKSAVENGKIAIKGDTVVAKEGEVVSQKLAAILQRLKLEPMEIGLDLIAVCENNEIITKEVLDINPEEYLSNIKSAATMAINLSINTGYPTKETITLLIQKAAFDALSLALSQDILTDETVKTIIAKVEGQAKCLKLQLNIPDAPQVEKKTKEKKQPKVETKEEPQKVKEVKKEELKENNESKS